MSSKKKLNDTILQFNLFSLMLPATSSITCVVYIVESLLVYTNRYTCIQSYLIRFFLRSSLASLLYYAYIIRKPNKAKTALNVSGFASYVHDIHEFEATYRFRFNYRLYITTCVPHFLSDTKKNVEFFFFFLEI